MRGEGSWGTVGEWKGREAPIPRCRGTVVERSGGRVGWCGRVLLSVARARGTHGGRARPVFTPDSYPFSALSGGGGVVLFAEVPSST
eukprot:scaffold11526_cov121-Isochrysis_galbana.AAC.1